MKLSVEKVCLLIYYRKNKNDFVLGIICVFVFVFELSISLLRLTPTFILDIYISLLFFTYKYFSLIFVGVAPKAMQNRL